jgi:hypothetical protein
MLIQDRGTTAMQLHPPPKLRPLRSVPTLFFRARPITDVRGSREYRSAMLEVMTERTWRLAVDRLRTRLQGGSA